MLVLDLMKLDSNASGSSLCRSNENLTSLLLTGSRSKRTETALCAWVGSPDGQPAAGAAWATVLLSLLRLRLFTAIRSVQVCVHCFRWGSFTAIRRVQVCPCVHLASA